VNIKQTWKACRSLFRVRFAEGLQYRVAAFSGVLISVFWALIECVVYTVFYTHGNNGAWNFNGLALPQTISYVWLAQGLWGIQTMAIDADILGRIKNGDIGVELCRPLDLYFHWFAKSSAGKLGGSWMRMLFTVMAGLLMPAGYALGPPASVWGFFLFAVTAAAAFLLCSSYGMLVTSIRISITWGDGPTYMLMLLSGVLSGAYLPLRLWPDFMQTFLRLQPFAGFTDIPAQLYVGSLRPSAALPAVALQLMWSLVFISAGRAIMRRRLKSVIIQGG
jgi:ABC-2 type transport system permease protein